MHRRRPMRPRPRPPLVPPRPARPRRPGGEMGAGSAANGRLGRCYCCPFPATDGRCPAGINLFKVSSMRIIVAIWLYRFVVSLCLLWRWLPQIFHGILLLLFLFYEFFFILVWFGFFFMWLFPCSSKWQVPNWHGNGTCWCVYGPAGGVMIVSSWR